MKLYINGKNTTGKGESKWKHDMYEAKAFKKTKKKAGKTAVKIYGNQTL